MKTIILQSAVVACACIAAGSAAAQYAEGRIRGFANNPHKVLIAKGAAPTLNLVALDPAQASKDLADFQKQAAEDIRKREDENMAWLFWRDGKLIQESYHPKAPPENYFLSFSMVKSVVAIAVGKAMCEGKLSLADNATKFVPELRDSAYGNRSIEELLLMKTGIPFSEMDNAQGIFRAALSQQGTYDTPLMSLKAADYPPRSSPNWNYDSNQTEVLGRVLQAVTGGADKYLSEVFWSKIGAQSDAWFAVDNRKRLLAAGGLYAQPRDYLRAGIHFLNLVDEANPDACMKDFARKAVSPLSTINWAGYYGYGYQTWSRNPSLRNNDGVFELNGLFGQRIVVDPKTRVVALAVSSREGDLNRFYALVNKLRAAAP